MKRRSSSLINAILLIVGLIVIALVMANYRRIQNWLPKAAGEPANLIIDTQGIVGKLVPSWQYLAQGGEAANYRFVPAQKALSALSPKYVRLDHIYDFYSIVSRDPSGRLIYHWADFDAILSDITAAGAVPFLSLSYMPSALGEDLTGPPKDWSEWQNLVKNTIEHVSGLKGLNLPNVYYEVWNEPDLFGNWKTYGSKNYLTLYEYSAKGAASAQNVNTFKFGGPASTKLYDNWVTRFVDFTVKNNLRFDFFSWHHYTDDPEEYLEDYFRYDALMRAYPNLILNVEPVISEWGIDSAINPAYDNQVSAAHYASVIATLMPRINKLFTFEFQDGLDQSGKEYWGRWGLVTHESFGSRVKPRYQAIQFFNRLGPDRLSIVGQGTYVKALAAKSIAGSTQLVVSNYDPDNRHVETFPLTFQRVEPGEYQLTLEYLGRSPQVIPLTTQTTTLTYSLTLPVNSVAYLETQTEKLILT